MHERSLVRTLIEQVLDEVRVRGLGRLHEVRLQIGEFSGVEPQLVESAFAEMASDVWDSAVQLTIEVVPLTARCPSCDEDFHVENFRFICPLCGGGNVLVTAGEEMRLASVSAERQTACNEDDSRSMMTSSSCPLSRPSGGEG